MMRERHICLIELQNEELIIMDSTDHVFQHVLHILILRGSSIIPGADLAPLQTSPP